MITKVNSFGGQIELSKMIEKYPNSVLFRARTRVLAFVRCLRHISSFTSLVKFDSMHI